ncbi:hypothetical protein PG996_000104 [Apiospora saccharicola]|uniref:F-box domain-containing protein n=1 Tax=Apiospora saccharicola TaxID=335842 RepID=A0ABR1WD22_9PEZI
MARDRAARNKETPSPDDDWTPCPACRGPDRKKAFKVPSSFAASSAAAAQRPSKDPPSPLAKLPNELWLSIFQNLRRQPVDQVSLALTCRRLLSVSQLLLTPVMLPSSFEHSHPRVFICDALRQLLDRVRPLTRDGRPDHCFALCKGCYKYRPMSREYWTRVVGKRYADRLATRFYDGYWKNVDQAIARWQYRPSVAWCPECNLESASRECEKRDRHDAGGRGARLYLLLDGYGGRYIWIGD